MAEDLRVERHGDVAHVVLDRPEKRNAFDDELAGRMAAAEILGRDLPPPPPETAMGALVTHITGGAEAKTFQPMNVNFGLFPPIDAKGGRKGRKDRYKAYTDRAKDAFAGWLATQG